MQCSRQTGDAVRRNGWPAALHCAALGHGPETPEHEPGIRAADQGIAAAHDGFASRKGRPTRLGDAHCRRDSRLSYTQSPRDLAECQYFGYAEMTGPSEPET